LGIEPSVGELRYIARLNADLLPNEEPFGVVSNIGGGSVVEGEDVVCQLLNWDSLQLF
jgi:rhamnogalacturonan endolyase